MNFYFKILFKVVPVSFFAPKSVSFQIESLAIISDGGIRLVLEDVSIKKAKKAVTKYISDHDLSDGVSFIGYECGAEIHLLQKVVDFLIDGHYDMHCLIRSAVAMMGDECFTPQAEYTYWINKSPDEHYSINDKLEMVFSHPDIPLYDKSNAFSYAMLIRALYYSSAYQQYNQ